MNAPLLKVDNLVKYFPVRQGIFSRVKGYVKAVDGVSFAIQRGETLSLVGESGSGKTTTGRAVLRLIEPTRGSIVFDGTPIVSDGKPVVSNRAMRSLRKRMQIIFQDPYGSLNPRMTVYSVLAEAMAAHGIGEPDQRRDRVLEMLARVGLPPEAADRYPNEFSGGQRQRIGIARALVMEPDLIVADEPVSALDVSIQAQILNLLEDIQRELGISYLFIGHNLSVVKHISDRVAVMYLGKIVEIGATSDIFAAPIHPYTRALLAAVPTPVPRSLRPSLSDKEIPVLSGDIPSPLNPPSGCRFHPRCPDAIPRCSIEEPVLAATKNNAGHCAACHVHAPAGK